jgi:hypothetical protein
MATAPSKEGQQCSHQRQPAAVGRRKWFGAAAFRGGGGAPMVREGIDEVLQLEEGTRKVRHDPKGADVGGTWELTEGERNCGAVV